MEKTEITNAIEIMLTAWHENGRLSFEADCGNLDHDTYNKKTYKDRTKYICLDRRGSGVFMYEKSTGLVYGIKAYGVIHRGKKIGTLAEMTRQYNAATLANQGKVLNGIKALHLMA